MSRQPRERLTSTVAESPGDRWSHSIHNDRKTKTIAGDSGCGLFNSQGQLIAIHTGPGENQRVELFRAHWDELHRAFYESDRSPLADTREKLEASYRKAGQSAVEILDGDKRVALATIVRGNGLLLTKASPLPDSFDCRLPGGRVLPGQAGVYGARARRCPDRS